MDSPENNRIVTTSSSSPPVQDSPFFNYLSNLSPIKTVKTVRVAQGFSEINFSAPAPVFTSPRINTKREASFLKRPQYFHSSNTEFSQNDDRVKMLIASSDVSGPSITEPMVDISNNIQKKCDSNDSPQVHSCSPSGYIDEYLADHVDADSPNSADSHLKQSNDTPQQIQNQCTSSEETVVKSDIEIDAKKDTDSRALACETSLEKSGRNYLGRSLLPIKLVETKDKQKDAERLSNESPCLLSEQVNDFVESDLSPELASATENDENLVDQVSTESTFIKSKKTEHETVGLESLDNERSTLSISVCHNKSQKVKLQNTEVRKQDKWDCTTEVLNESLHIAQADEDHDKNSGVISRRSFEKKMPQDLEAASQNRGTRRRCLQFEAAEAQRNILGTSHSCNSENSMDNLQLPAILEILDSSHLKSSATSSMRQPVKLSQPITSRLSRCAVENTEAHVDNVDRFVQKSGNALLSVPRPSGIGLHLNSIVNAAAMGSSATASMKFTEREHPRILEAKSEAVIDHHLPEDSKMISLATNTVENFSANTSDDQQESLAIVVVPSQKLKVAEHHMTPDAKRSASENADRFEEINQLSPKKKRKRASHTIEKEGCKRCNCKRSKCLKLYCECFAAGVYCAEPCACLECFNKPEYEDTVLGTRQQIESRNPLAFAPKIVRHVTESPANTGEDGNRMTPSSARHKRGCNCKKSMCLKKYCECYQAGVGCSDGCRCEGCKNVFGVKEEMVYKRAGERWEDTSSEKLDKETIHDILDPEQFHPHNLSPLTPSFQYSSHGKDASKSRLPAIRCLPSPESDSIVLSSYGKSPVSPLKSNSNERRQKMSGDNFSTSSVSSNSRDCTKVSRTQLCHGSGRLSAIGSLRWRSSPITPISRLGGCELPQESDSDNRLFDILEDDTPDILKDTRTPIKAVKASSPNQKRVSPPHSRLHELRSSSSPGLKSGRKFILQAVPSFPPLTPYSEPKCSGTGK
ncbi:PREDICTED: uncharacterized protein LOC104592360 isoform X2 [Nelumbo nucifera]|uniref:CRC domain-containing protein n=2 Tax=Nelumbo nucifera TaxID=4432 RepID=A0A822ZIZ3_NELNU|nr:PREDICTED: uncharacterized protein LOC104592360 isoform X2 [Nelumbo nucifera]DAD44847.1 TPA_asm: hypothetical protein HUJ06_003077 [Nelumbo nucifera]